MSELIKKSGLDIRAQDAKQTLSGWWVRWRQQSRDNRSVLVIALLAAVVAASIVVILWTASQNYVPLYGRQEMYDTANILELLEKEQVPFKLDTASGQVLVPEAQLAQVRIALAARGVRAAMPSGMEGLDTKVGLGTSEFMENMRYRNALEGELARTIIGLDAVRSARVHLAIPKRTLFVGRDEERPTASVMLDMAAGQRLERGQVEAIVNLVAGSISGLKPEGVTVVDQTGRLLSAELADADSMGQMSLQQIDYVRRLEDYIRQRAADMLYPLLGNDNFRIQVAADVNFNKVEETHETVDPTPVLRSETGKNNDSVDKIATGIPGSLSNRPPVTATDTEKNKTAPTQTPADARSQRSEFNREYENGRSVTHTQFQMGRLEHLHVSVLLNQSIAPKAGWSKEQLTEMEAMVQRAVGFEADRGDQISVTSFPFTPAAVDPSSYGEAWWQKPILLSALRYGIGTLLCLVLVLLGIRPLVKHLVQQNKPALVEQVATREREPGVGGESSGGKSGMTPSMMAVLEDMLPGEMDLPPLGLEELPPVGSDYDVQLKHLQLLVDQETTRVTEVIKLWVNGNNDRS
jgi:flagellar M-ring protein FliF